MLAIHDQFTDQMRNRLKTSCMGVGLVRLLQSAKRFDEARTTLYSLEEGFRGVAKKSDKPRQKSCKAKRTKGTTKTASCSSELASTRIDAAEATTQPLSIA